jgi:PucR C-terminal helix-turn-helix domain/GGDEF-like domain
MLHSSERSVLTAVRRVARALLPDLPSIGDGTLSHILAAMPEIPQGGMIELARASCHANSKALLEGLINSVPFERVTPSAEVLQSTRAMVQHNFSHDAIMRAYRVGLIYWCARWAEAVERHCTDMSLAVPVASYGTTFLIGWLDLIMDRLSAEYKDEAERIAREGSMAWAAYVRRALTEDDIDMRDASLRLGYNLGGDHVALVLNRHHSGDQTPLDSTARQMAGGLTRAKPLVVRIDVDTVWCWIPTKNAREVLAPQADVLVGQGRPSTGLLGFRRSHQEACDALRVARLGSYAAGTVTHFGHVELVVLCANDPAYCRAFIAEKLGRLAAETNEARRLRATLKGFFDANSNLRAAGISLGIHHNTVRYRLERAEALLGRPVREHRLHLEIAIQLLDRLTLPTKSRDIGEVCRVPR